METSLVQEWIVVSYFHLWRKIMETVATETILSVHKINGFQFPKYKKTKLQKVAMLLFQNQYNI